MQVENYRRISSLLRSTRMDSVVVFLSSAISFIFYSVMPLLLLFQYHSQNSWIKTAIYAACTFLLVSMLRRIINRPRPYEVMDFSPVIQKNTHGCSFPSRHVFSAFLIAMLWLSECCWIGIILLCFSLMLSALRVIGGVHYISDIAAGAFLGILSGFIYITVI